MIRLFSLLSLWLVPAGAAMAQDAAPEQPGSTWTVWEQQEPRRCFAVSSPQSTVNTRDGREVSVRRSDILLTVSYVPDDGIVSQIAFTGGYPFDEDVPVTLEVGEQTFEMPIRGEWSWASDAGADAEIVGLLKEHQTVVATGISSRGTKTQDTFSLFGFGASVEEAAARCAP